VLCRASLEHLLLPKVGRVVEITLGLIVQPVSVVVVHHELAGHDLQLQVRWRGGSRAKFGPQAREEAAYLTSCVSRHGSNILDFLDRRR